MIRRLLLRAKWKFFELKNWFVRESIELLAPGFQSFSEELLGEVIHLRIENMRLNDELRVALDAIEGHIKASKKSKRRKK